MVKYRSFLRKGLRKRENEEGEVKLLLYVGNATVRTVTAFHTFVAFERWPNGWFLFICVRHDGLFLFTV